MSQTKIEVLYEDNHLLVVNKPAGLPTMGVADGKPSVLAAAKDYIKAKYQKPGNVYLGVVSRLDAPVTGALLIARTSKAAARLSKQFRERAVEKVYNAVVEGVPQPPKQELQHWLRKDERHRRVHVTQTDTETAQRAQLRFEVLETFSRRDVSLVRVVLDTGRKHQIRVQLSAIGHPIVGDRKYKSQTVFSPGIMLHSRQLRFEHPTRKEEIAIDCPHPEVWAKWL